jgi:CheY-like chemotaxis protein
MSNLSQAVEKLRADKRNNFVHIEIFKNGMALALRLTTMQATHSTHLSDALPQRRKTRSNILIADDDPDLRRIVARVLRRDGFAVTELASGWALLGHLGSALVRPNHVLPPDLIIADVCMPGFSGIEVLAGLHRRPWSIPVVLITASDDSHVSSEALRYGASAFLKKPFQITELQMLVRSLLERDK